jgi:predicted molibdopterin-dependent oxidoreductase YjgC
MDGSMFKHDATTYTSVEVILDGQHTSLPAEISVAAALLTIGEITSRISPTSKKPCSPHCLMGVCFECLMEIDGIRRQACMTTVKEGMVINRNLSDGEGEQS